MRPDKSFEDCQGRAAPRKTRRTIYKSIWSYFINFLYCLLRIIQYSLVTGEGLPEKYKMKVVMITVFLFLLTIGGSLRCYQCGPCEIGEMDEQVGCPPPFDVCLTATYDNISETYKSCHRMSQCERDCQAVKDSDSGYCSCCDTDWCNGGASARVSILTIYVPVATAFGSFL